MGSLCSQTMVEELKEKLWKKMGTAVGSMRLELRDEAGTRVADLDRDAAPLAAYSPYDGSVHPPPASVAAVGLMVVCSEGTACTSSTSTPRQFGSKLRTHSVFSLQDCDAGCSDCDLLVHVLLPVVLVILFCSTNCGLISWSLLSR